MAIFHDHFQFHHYLLNQAHYLIETKQIYNAHNGVLKVNHKLQMQHLTDLHTVGHLKPKHISLAIHLYLTVKMSYAYYQAY